MPLPKPKHPTFTTKLPSTGKTVRFRTMTAQEQKILLFAKESKQPSDVLNAILQVVNMCVVDGCEVDKIAIFDLEWLFIQIRIVSVSNESEVTYIDNDDEKSYDFKVDLTKVEVRFPETAAESKIEVADGIVMQLKWPTAVLYSDDKLLSSDQAEAFERLLAYCIDKVYDQDQVYDPSDDPLEDTIKWIQELSLESYEKAQEYLSRIPHVYYKIDYKNAAGDDREIVLTSLSDFFTFV
jgi:hypothetical protein